MWHDLKVTGEEKEWYCVQVSTKFISWEAMHL